MIEKYRLLKEAMMNVASHETAYLTYNPEKSRLHNHCGAVAWVIKQQYGGVLLGGKIDGISHIWNQLPDGTEIDLTSCQFGGDGYTPLTKGEKLPERTTINPKYKLFAKKLDLSRF